MKILVTGGAGFIGSNLVQTLLEDDRVIYVRVLDDLSTGFRHNLKSIVDHPKFEFMEGDISDYKTCVAACKNIDRISHQAALGSVPRSIKNPIRSNEVNIGGTLNILTAAKEEGIDRVVYAASSSTYGDSKKLPKIEDEIGQPLSPYAVTKLVNELYAKVFHDLYDIDTVGLRYFNIFGPQQDPNGAYAAVIPLFFKAALENNPPTINGDGSFSRDFTFVANAVQANILALFTEEENALNQVYNIACGSRTTLNELWAIIKKESGTQVDAQYGAERVGDVSHSLADINKAKRLLGYSPEVSVEEGLKYAFEWYKTSL
ncbi:MAG: SDR family oxidoreductase [Bacteroidota bacterium]